MKFSALPVACLALALLAGCSGMKTYPNSHEKNALVRVKNEGGGLFSSTRPDVHLYSVNAVCQAEYLGVVELDAPSVKIGLPVGQTILLEFVFSKATLGQQSATSIEMMTTPRRGSRYEFEVSYLRNGYTATGVEFQPGQPKGREMEPRRLRDCAATRKKAGA